MLSQYQTGVTLARVNYLLWLWRVINWDTLVLALLVFVPAVVEALFPKPDDALLIVAAVLPPIACFFRLHTGIRLIELNHCSAFVRVLQTIAHWAWHSAISLF